MNILELKLDDFLAFSGTPASDRPYSDLNLFGIFDAGLLQTRYGSYCDLGDGYRLIKVDAQLGDIFLTHNSHCVGIYCGETLDIAPEHRKKWLSVPMILEAIKDRHKPDVRKHLTFGGLAALTNAWQVAHGRKPSQLKGYDPTSAIPHWQPL